MNIRKVVLIGLFGLIIAAPGLSRASYYDDDVIADTAKVSLIGGAVAAGCYGLYKFGSWLFSKTDQQILDEAHRAYDSAHNRYQSLMAILESWYNAGRSVRSANENLLYEIGTAKIEEQYIGNYISDLNQALSTLRSNLKTVTERAYKLQQQALHDSQIYYVKREMDGIAGRINHLLPRLSFLEEFLAYHKSYFILFELESDLYGKYDRELRAIENQALDYYGRAYEIRAAILTNFSHSTYPYLQYSRHIKDDCAQLDSAIHNLVHNYYDRVSAARQLYTHLITIKEIVLTDSHYHHDVHAYEKDKRERERIEAEERKARALERQARAQEQKVREMKEYNRIYACKHTQYHNKKPSRDCVSFEVQISN
ncbi:hypothetical protein KC460_03420 [Candidatus Dependentiae bacterium]|nr:hypothetical protein [Candidatus Dependentiae bacterium]